MADSLNVIALISGGKDSFFSILHCIQNGHKVVALGNLYPPAPSAKSHLENPAKNVAGREEVEQDLNSFMYQTVGHTVIPLYEAALGIPLYRQQIIGNAIQTAKSYVHSPVRAASSLGSESESVDENEDETESLVPLLKRIMVEHPDANALSTGAILSTYQRTRVESVALRLGLTPLSYLWQYPTLPPGTQASLLRDMQAVGLDARILKVASGGLNESFLWQNVASESSIQRVERSMKRFGVDGDGGVLGEGGEFETLVMDGPGSLFKGRIEIREEDRSVVREDGGAAWLRISDAKVIMKCPPEPSGRVCRVPDILEQRFKDVLDSLENSTNTISSTILTGQSSLFKSLPNLDLADTELPDTSNPANCNNTLYWEVSGRQKDPSHTIIDQAAEAVLKVRQLLHQSSLDPTSIVSTTIILRSMQDFASVNSIYGTLFTAPNPPSRVTISCGSLLPKGINILIYLKLTTSPVSSSPRTALHVQSRSYWAPANIGPYSQATSIAIPSSSDTLSNISAVSIAGQIPLIPSSMTLPPLSPDSSSLESFKFQTILSLQHLFRIASAMSVSWLTGVVAYLPSSPTSVLSNAQRARISGHAWMCIHARPSSDDSSSPNSPDDNGDDQARDLWEEKHYAGLETMGRSEETKMLPNWDVVSFGDQQGKGPDTPSFWAAEVEELPRGAGIEWAALSGVVGGAVTLSSKAKDGGWTAEQCRFGDVVQSVVQVLYSSGNAEIGQRVEEALGSAGLGADVGAVASWLDVSIEGIGSALAGKKYGGVVPCKSLWDKEGRRLAAVFVFETTA